MLVKKSPSQKQACTIEISRAIADIFKNFNELTVGRDSFLEMEERYFEDFLYRPKKCLRSFEIIAK